MSAKKTKKTTTRKPIKKKMSVKVRVHRFIRNLQERSRNSIHRSFRLTRRRDYKRKLEVPGYFALTFEVGGFIRKNIRLFLGLVTLYAVIVLVLGGLSSQEVYMELQDSISEDSMSDGGSALSTVSQATMTLLSAVSGPSNLGDTQQLYLVIAVLLIWMCTVWLTREIMAGHAPRLRDGLYNSAAPFVSTLLIAIVALLQLIPVGILALVYAALSGIGVIDHGFGAMLFGIIALTVVSLTLYWLTSTFIALVVVTLPGMYPIQALRLSSQLVLSRRLRVMLRILWLALLVIGCWLLVYIPVILLEGWLRGMWAWLENIPTVPILIIVGSALTTVYVSTYIYIFYRKLVSDESIAGR